MAVSWRKLSRLLRALFFNLFPLSTTICAPGKARMRHIVQLANAGVLISDLALLEESLNQLVLAPFC
jgi:hypothetical protein